MASLSDTLPRACMVRCALERCGVCPSARRGWDAQQQPDRLGFTWLVAKPAATMPSMRSRWDVHQLLTCPTYKVHCLNALTCIVSLWNVIIWVNVVVALKRFKPLDTKSELYLKETEATKCRNKLWGAPGVTHGDIHTLLLQRSRQSVEHK